MYVSRWIWGVCILLLQYDHTLDYLACSMIIRAFYRLLFVPVVAFVVAFLLQHVPRKRLVVCYNGILQYPVIYPATSYKLQASALNSQLWSFVFLLQHIHTYVYDWYVRKCVWFKCMWHTCADISSISQVNPFDNDRSWSGDQCQLLSCS